MLSSEDSRRLAQMERQLRRDDPEFCARMSGNSTETPPKNRASLGLILTASAIWVAALILGLARWWIAAAISALWATVLVAALTIRVIRRRSSPR